MYVVRSERRDELVAALKAAGVESRAHYAEPLHRQPAMAPYAEGVELPGTDLAAATNFALPMRPDARRPDRPRPWSMRCGKP